MRIIAIAFAILTMLSAVSPAAAIEKPLEMDQAFKATVEREEDGRAVIRWQILDGYYLYRDYLSAENEDGSRLELQTNPGTVKDDPNFGSTEIYYSSATASLPGAPQKFRVTYQGCQDKGLCYPPTTKTVDLASLSVEDGGIFSSSGFAPARQTSATFSEIDAGNDFSLSDDHARTAVDRMLADGGMVLLLGGFVGFGLLLAFTPCVFPMYPIVAAMLTREGERLTARRGFLLSSSYVLALAIAFGLLGMAAAWSGQNLQIALQSTYAAGAICILFAILALSNFGLFHIQIPSAISARFGKTSRGRGTIAGAVALGFTSALLIGPCVTAPLAGALLYIARTGDVVIGAAALFALGLGKGIPLIVMATASGKALPRAGMWMEKVRQLFGFAFLATALWMATPLVPEQVALLGWALVALSFGVFAFSAAAAHSQSGMTVVARTTGLASVIWAGLLFVGLGLGATDPLAPLKPLTGSGGPAAIASIDKADFAKVSSIADLGDRIDDAPGHESTLLYVTADWCVTCRTIERSHFTSPEVIAAVNGLNLVSLDLTKLDADKQATLSALKVIGPPTMVFLDSKRREPSATRLVGEFSIRDLATSARKAKHGEL
ncbi:protein-disulfide reductase DsbD [Agrobacterium tumefaciens]|uniref:protein-disulfide reductase DsbD n=1 Tax=Agrobacterium tumefaciens TaxID=358 RepID=UPI000EF1FC19|nr:protein-disulfide reductase DsbD [Agrobacterium tumefaciens]AYM09080.1 thiol:disulfide interchange protein DsbD [Agrobacterium tumefaciens]NSZ33260.1 protein-disulfide reductase DsbD [Agrobacterium tumefaciens]QLG25656.1 protein-disulfide reductase DsbD [Agrobacterium tumefaciens]UXS89366.1 protein-disulfide reductase DsbD [Agrobacterium tumefaciens]